MGKSRLICKKGDDAISCNRCDLNFCSEYCESHHVCHEEELDYEECISNPVKMLQWMFARLRACVKCLFGTVAGQETPKSYHFLEDLFKTDYDPEFTKVAIAYWGALKSGPASISQVLIGNCKIEFYTNKQLLLSGLCTFKDSDFETICSHIENNPHLHKVCRHGIISKVSAFGSKQPICMQ
jgi:hypothetical protein